MPNEDPRLGRLLAGRNEPSVLETDEVLAAVLDEVAPPRGQRWKLPAVAAVLAAAAALLLWVRKPDLESEEFTARGGGRATAALEVRCLSEAGPSAVCTPGAKLALELVAPEDRPFFALLMLHPGQGVTWYFPDADGVMVRVSDAGAAPPWSRAARLAPDLVPGHYELVGAFARQPLTRMELKEELGADLAGSADLTVIRRRIEVSP